MNLNQDDQEAPTTIVRVSEVMRATVVDELGATVRKTSLSVGSNTYCG